MAENARTDLMRRREVMRRFAVAIAILLCVTGPGTVAARAEMTPVRAAYIPVVTWLPAWVAKEKGLFEENGLDVSLTATQNVSLLPGTLGRQFDLAPATPPDLIKAVAADLDVIGVAGEAVETQGNPSTLLIVRADSPIRIVGDLKGRVVATPTLGAIVHVSLLYLLKQNGIDPSGHPRRRGSVSRGLCAHLLCAIHKGYRSSPSSAPRGPSLERAREFIAADPHEARTILAKYTRLPAAVVEKMPFPTYRFSLDLRDFKVYGCRF
jgi:NitT/TauT family transport system substrate-binding protein